MRIPRWTGGVLLALALVGIVAFLYVEGAQVATTGAVKPLPLQSSTSTPATTASSTATTTKSGPQLTIASIPTAKLLASAAIAAQVPAPVSAATQQSKNLTASGGKLLSSIVNIVCLSTDPSIPSISGSGVMIDPRGIILTVSHVAQLFTLQDYLGSDKVSCLIRTGSPARRAYLAEPIYVSKTWIANNPDTLTEKSPKGTGENDVALLAVTGTATSTPLPSSFTYTPLASIDPEISDQLAIGSYGAQYLSGTELNYSLYPILTFGSVQDRYTFDTSTVDVITVAGSAASQEGSSGGGLATSDGQVIGLITTSTISGDIATRTLNAITANYIRRSYQQDMGAGLDSTLANQSIPSLVEGFANESKILGAQLESNIESNR